MSDHSDIWKYNPSIPLAGLATAIFNILTGIHGYQLFRTKTWYFIAFWAGGVCECVGYTMRIWSAEEGPDYTVGPYAVSQVAVLIAPSLFAASMYMELGRIIRLCGGEAYTIVRVSWLTKIFVIGDVAAFLLQGGGSGLLASDNSDTTKTGERIVIVGLVAQIIFFALFVVTSLIFHRSIHRTPTAKLRQHPNPP
ncbi:Putative RTA-like protein [Septoria linicola]|uniref:RTA-like protein n=1 Tax=Septoria linicola TaxID=215465 RepID=A0A9Q9EH72_9PEZI|nr:putative RTA-like protein [Septoria linicola]USW50715.1 Putative RTA-like protein [Septoria linicola]